MTRTVDLVVTGDDRASLAAAADALQRGQRVLVVLPAGDRRLERSLRRRLRTRVNAADSGVTRVTVMTNAEVVCVGGVDRVEAVVIRYARSGRLYAVNASAFLRTGGTQP